jgi:glycosyltransferase involved in cell wall biosynthesis
MLLVLPVPFRLKGNRLLFEAQACNGLNRWADNFSKVVAAAPVMPEEIAQADKTIVWEDTTSVLNDRVTCIPLPWAYGIKDFVRNYPRCRKLLAEQIKACEYLQFAIGGLVGDWAALAAVEAKKQGRPYAIHTDRVESQLLRKLASGSTGPRAWKKRIEADLMDRYHRYVITPCAAGLWHGQECYAAYSPWCKNNHIVHDVHTKPSDAISAQEMEVKLQEVCNSNELRIAYAGRMAEMKAPLEWVKAIGRARDKGVAVSATWYGDGELRPKVEAEINALGLNGMVNLAGFVSDRKVLLEGLRNSHLMLFTHITPESPRCLLEALICGTAIVGYDNAFAQDLTVERGGGSYVPMHDWQALGERIAELSGRRSELRRLLSQAAANGKRFNDEDLFKERSEIVKHMAHT